MIFFLSYIDFHLTLPIYDHYFTIVIHILKFLNFVARKITIAKIIIRRINNMYFIKTGYLIFSSFYYWESQTSTRSLRTQALNRPCNELWPDGSMRINGYIYLSTGKPKDIEMRISVRGSWVGLLQSALQNKGKN